VNKGENYMNAAPPNASSFRKPLPARLWSTFKSMPVVPKAIVICLVTGLLYAAGRTPNPTPGPPVPHSSNFTPTPVSGNFKRTVASPQSQQLAQLWAQHEKLASWAKQCMAEMNQMATLYAGRAMTGQMPVQAPCAQSMYQATAQIALLETEISQLQGQQGSVCSLTGYCASSSSTPSSGGSSPSYYDPNHDSGTEAVERASREGILGQCIYNSEDGDQAQLSCEGGDHYWQNVEHGGFNNLPDPPNNGYDYRRFNYSPQ
jgi:hypothetical protein